MDSIHGLTMLSSFGVGFTIGNMAYVKYTNKDDYESSVQSIICEYFFSILGGALMLGTAESIYRYLKNNKRLT